MFDITCKKCSRHDETTNAGGPDREREPTYHGLISARSATRPSLSFPPPCVFSCPEQYPLYRSRLQADHICCDRHASIVHEIIAATSPSTFTTWMLRFDVRVRVRTSRLMSPSCLLPVASSEVSIDPPALSMHVILRSLHKSYDLYDEPEPLPERQL